MQLTPPVSVEFTKSPVPLGPHSGTEVWPVVLFQTLRKSLVPNSSQYATAASRMIQMTIQKIFKNLVMQPFGFGFR
jgi:hypothetical protein